MDPLPFTLRELRGAARLFVTAFLVTVTIGYLTGIYFVAFTTHGTPAGTVHQFRGNEEEPLEEIEEIKYEKGSLEMLNIIHTHVTSFALIFFAVGGVFLFSSAPPGLKAALAVEPFAATLLLFGGMAGMRYLGEGMALPLALVMMLAGLSTFVCVIAMTSMALWEMWK